jgi:hypothetical protein
VFLDLDGDGRRGPSEPAAGLATLAVRDAEVLTGPDGRFSAWLAPGPAEVRVLDADGLPPEPRTVELAPRGRLALEVPVRPAASLEVRVEAAGGARVPAGLAVLAEGGGASVVLPIGPDGAGSRRGLPPGRYALTAVGVPGDLLASLPDAVDLAGPAAGAVTLRLEPRDVEVSTAALEPEVSLEPAGPLPPGAEPLVRVRVDGGADRVGLLLPDGSRLEARAAADGSFEVRLPIPRDAVALYAARAVVERGGEVAERRVAVPLDAALPLGSLSLEPGVLAPGLGVRVSLTLLFVADEVRLDGPGLSVRLERDPRDPTRWTADFVAPASWSGRVPLELTATSARLTWTLGAAVAAR